MAKSKGLVRHYRNLAEQKAFMEKIESLLKDNEYMFAKQLASKCGTSVGTISKYIRMMREKGIGIHSTKRGYILSEFASKKNDTEFLRRLNGRRLSDYYAASSAQPHINSRWSTSGPNKTTIGLAFSATLSAASPTKIKESMKQLLIESKKIA